MPEVLLLAVAALLVGYAKTSIGGLASISIAVFASVMPARESTAAILVLLITGDLVAVWHYRRHADWALLRSLVPTVLPGLALGAAFLAVVDDTVLRRSIGVLLLLMAALQLVLQWRSPDAAAVGRSRPATVATGLAAGFTTMTANAAGAVMTLYLVARGVGKAQFLGTGALFFLGVNLCKIPFSAGLGLFSVRDPASAPRCSSRSSCWAPGPGCTPRGGSARPASTGPCWPPRSSPPSPSSSAERLPRPAKSQLLGLPGSREGRELGFRHRRRAGACLRATSW